MAHFIDTQSWKVVANVLVDTRPRIVEYTPDQRQIWVTSEVGGTVSIIDAASRKIIHTIGFEIAGMRPELITPVGVRFTSDGRTALVALGRANHVAVIDTASYTVKRSLLVGQRVWQLALSADGNRLYAVNGLTNDISVIDVPNLKALITVPVGRLPWVLPSNREDRSHIARQLTENARMYWSLTRESHQDSYWSGTS